MGELGSHLKISQISSYIHFTFILSKIRVVISIRFFPYPFYNRAHI